DPRRWPLHVIQAKTLDDAFEKLYQDHGPRGAWRRRQEEECARLRLLNREVPLELGNGGLYQQLPLLHQVQRERLPREERAGRDGGNDGGERGHGPQDFRWWAEEVRNERRTTRPYTIDELFVDFGRVERAPGPIPRFVVLGEPGGGKTTLVQV